MTVAQLAIDCYTTQGLTAPGNGTTESFLDVMKDELVTVLRNTPSYLDMYLHDKQGTKLANGEVAGWVHRRLCGLCRQCQEHAASQRLVFSWSTHRHPCMHAGFYMVEPQRNNGMCVGMLAAYIKDRDFYSNLVASLQASPNAMQAMLE